MTRKTFRAIHGVVNMKRDAAGVPHLQATCWEDAFYGLGWLHGRDRGGQVAVTRIAAEGRICELLQDNDAMLEVDRYFRRLGLARDARQAYPALSAPYSGYLQAYAQGLTDGWRLPWALRLAGLTLDAFAPSDALLILKLLAYAGLAEGQRIGELFLIQAIQRGVDAARLKALFPALDALDADLIRGLKFVPPLFPGARTHLGLSFAGGSNAWVIAPERTRYGAPLLANDPHLEINRLPAVAYEAVIEVDGQWIKGATIPGTPGFLSARTRNLSWGVTYSCADTSDFFIERCHNGHYLRQGEWFPFRVRDERLARKKHPPVDFRCHENEHGILETDRPEDGDHLCWNWTGFGRAGLGSIQAFTDLMQSRTVEQAQQAMQPADIPTLHMVFADRSGNIGYQFIGAVPRRREDWSGLAPVAGWEPANDWQGLRQTNEKPAEFNPARGYIAITNEARQVADGPRLSTLWLSDYRRQRIEQLLQDNDALTPATMQDMQYDIVSLQAARFLPEYLGLLPAGEARDRLGAWDGRYHADAVAATLFEDLHRSVIIEIFGGQTPGREWLGYLVDETNLYISLTGFFDDVLAQPDSPWLPRSERRPRIAQALRNRLDRHRPMPPWGKTNQFVLTNLFLGGRLPRFLGFDRGPYPLAGNQATIHQGSLFKVGSRLTSFAPCYHVVHDLGSDASWSNLPGGASESRLSRWYISDLARWRQGRYKPL